MTSLVQLLPEYGLACVFFYLLLQQAGAPLPAFPVLMLAGALAARGEFAPHALLGTAAAACLLADTFWYCIGARVGRRVLNTICRISLSPDVCVSQTESIFSRWGAPSLLVAKFVPGFSSIASALSGALGVRAVSYLFFASLGAVLWAGCWLLVGWIFAPVVMDLIRVVGEFGRFGVALIALAACAFALSRWRRRARFNERLRTDRISVDSLAELMEAETRPVIVDVRHEMARYDGRIPGAITVSGNAWPAELQSTPRDGVIVVYCACPDDTGAAAVAIRLMQRGYRNVRPLEGGINAWRAAGRVLQADFA